MKGTSISKQIGWSSEANLLYEILKQLERLQGIVSKLVPLTTTTTTTHSTTTTTTTVPATTTTTTSSH